MVLKPEKGTEQSCTIISLRQKAFMVSYLILFSQVPSLRLNNKKNGLHIFGPQNNFPKLNAYWIESKYGSLIT